jgi:predicted esterase
MKLSRKKVVEINLIVVLSLLISMAPAQDSNDVRPDLGSGPDAGAGTSRITSPPVGTTAGQSRRTGGDPVDDRVELREYLFTDTGEMLPYAVFVSSKVRKDKKAPLVLALHGFSGNHGTFMRTQCVDAAEKNGYILVGAMGYSPSGSFGMPMRGLGAPKAADGPKPPAKPKDGAPRKDSPGRGIFMGMRGGHGGTKETVPSRVAELSEKDAMNVLEIARREFNIDEDRIYLMGHSLGGGGALHMGEKYSSIWAAVAGLAPAAFGFQWSEDQKLKKVPLLIIVGDEDRLVTGSQQLADQLKGLNFQVEYKSLPGLDHGEIIGGSMPDVFKFFNRHTRAN